MNSINLDSEPKKKKAHKNILKISLSMAVLVFVFNTDPDLDSDTSFFEFVKPAEGAGTLTSIGILPTNNIVNTRTTYDIMFKTATTGTIKTIQMTFPSGFDVSAATRLIERSGVGSGSLSNPSGSTLVYTISSPVSVVAGTSIRLEIGKVINSETEIFAGKVGITTKNTAGNTIDGPTSSPSFPIKTIERLDISPELMVRKTLDDNTAGHAHGWDPNGVTTDFTISDSDIEVEEESGDQTLITLMLRYSHDTGAICMVNHTQEDSFLMNCNAPPASNAQLHYEIHRLAANVITSSLSSSAHSSVSSQRTGSISTQDETASDFP